MQGLCSFCQREKKVHPNRVTKELVCQPCHQRNKPPQTCSICQSSRADVFWNKQAQALVCSKCYKQKYKPRVPCSICTQVRAISAFDDSGRPVCEFCRRVVRNTDDCSICHERRIIGKRLPDGQKVCTLCYRSFINLKQCWHCGLVKPMAKKFPDQTYLCRPCLEQTRKGHCPRCGNWRPLTVRIEGQLCCLVCRWEYNTAECQRCGQRRPIVAQGKCGSCYQANRQFRLASAIDAMSIGVSVYHVKTRLHGVVRGKRTPLLVRNKIQRLRRTELLVRCGNGAKQQEVFWLAIECRKMVHITRHRKQKL